MIHNFSLLLNLGEILSSNDTVSSITRKYKTTNCFQVLRNPFDKLNIVVNRGTYGEKRFLKVDNYLLNTSSYCCVVSLSIFTSCTVF